MASSGFFQSFAAGLLILVLGEIFLTPLSKLLGSTPTVLPYTLEYMGVVLLGAPFLTSSLTLNNQMRPQGNAALAMYGTVTGVPAQYRARPHSYLRNGLGTIRSGMGNGHRAGGFVLYPAVYVAPRREHRYSFPSFFRLMGTVQRDFYGGSPSLSSTGFGQSRHHVTQCCGRRLRRFGHCRHEHRESDLHVGIGRCYRIGAGFSACLRLLLTAVGMYDRLKSPIGSPSGWVHCS